MKKVLPYQSGIIHRKGTLTILLILLVTLHVGAITPRPLSDCPYTDYISGHRTDSNDYFTAEQPTESSLSHIWHEVRDRMSISTNLLYDAVLTPNIGIGISVSDRVTVLADWMYARWNNRDKRHYWRIYGGDIEVKYRLGNLRASSPLGGHRIGLYASIACYDFQKNRRHTGVLSDKYNYAAGVSYTYSLPVATRFNIDFSLGVGYMWGIYKKHRPIDDCDVWLSTHRQSWFGPTRVGVSLVWLIGNPLTNIRKGGYR